MTCRGLILRPPVTPRCADCQRREQPGETFKLHGVRYYCPPCAAARDTRELSRETLAALCEPMRGDV